jgi:hypothetical protein
MLLLFVFSTNFGLDARLRALQCLTGLNDVCAPRSSPWVDVLMGVVAAQRAASHVAVSVRNNFFFRTTVWSIYSRLTTSLYTPPRWAFSLAVTRAFEASQHVEAGCTSGTSDKCSPILFALV